MAAPTIRTRKFLTNRLMGRKQFVRQNSPAMPLAAPASDRAWWQTRRKTRLRSRRRASPAERRRCRSALEGRR